MHNLSHIIKLQKAMSRRRLCIPFLALVLLILPIMGTSVQADTIVHDSYTGVGPTYQGVNIAIAAVPTAGILPKPLGLQPIITLPQYE